MTKNASRPGAPLTARQMGLMQGFPPPPEKRPTLSNWDHAPFNRWSFMNVRSMIPTVDVRKGPHAWPLPEAEQDLSGLHYVRSDGHPETLNDCLINSYTDGWLVMHRGRVVEERYFNDMEPHTLHLAQSVSKSIVGTLAGILHGEGLLDLSAPLGTLVPELAASGYSDATLEQVLNMQSGVRFDESYENPTSDIARIDVASGWRPAPAHGHRETIRDVILSLTKTREHGGNFEYRSIETDVVAWVLERAAGARLADLVSDRIWAPMGAERDAYFTVDAAGTALADGGFNATLRDFARFGEMMRTGGRLGSEQIVPKAWVASLQTGDASRFGEPYTYLSPNGAYSRQWWGHDVDRGDFMARGVFGQLIYVDPGSELTVVKLSTWPTFLNPTFVGNTLRAIAAIREALTEDAA